MTRTPKVRDGLTLQRRDTRGEKLLLGMSTAYRWAFAFSSLFWFQTNRSGAGPRTTSLRSIEKVRAYGLKDVVLFSGPLEFTGRHRSRGLRRLPSPP